MDEAGSMGLPEAGEHLQSDAYGFLDCQRPALALAADELAQGHAVDLFHRDERSTVDLPNIVDGRQVGVCDRGGRACLAQEPTLPLVVAREARAQQLERHRSPQALVVGEIDDAHAAASELGADAKAAEGGADQRLARRHR